MPTTYTCTCPDFTQSFNGKLFTRGITSGEEREWNDIKTKPIPCKHIIATRIRLRDYNDIPRDVPLPKELVAELIKEGIWTDTNPEQNTKFV